MKNILKKTISVVAGTALTIAGATVPLLPQVTNASPDLSFTCKQNKNGTHTTFAVTPDGEDEFIRWITDDFTLGGYPPTTRCSMVTYNLNQFVKYGRGQTLTHGIMNKQPVLCLANKEGSGCDKLLYTLKPGQDGKETLRDLLVLNNRNFIGDPLLESKSCRIYVNIDALINGDLKTAKSLCK